MQQIACIYIVVPQQKRNILYGLEGGILQTSVFKIKS